MEPFLKWAGGKRWLIPKILSQLPQFETYYEPFAGSAGMFFALEPKRGTLSDTNADLINCYRCVRDYPDKIVKILGSIPINAVSYYVVRTRFLKTKSKVRKAAYFIFLNKTCWNGLYRVNKSGQFNVPVGRALRNVRVCDPDQLFKASKLLRRTRIRCCDFAEAVKEVRERDLVYFDPPYITTHLQNGFIKYNSKLFSHADELRLARLAHETATSGASILVSNASHPSIREHYDGPFFKSEFLRTSRIAADERRRGVFPELLITTFRVTF